MTKRYFEELMEEFGFHVVDTVALGMFKEWPVRIQKQEDELELRIVVPKQAKTCLKELKSKGLSYTDWFAQADLAHEHECYVLGAYIQTPSDFYLRSTLHTALTSLVKCLQEESYTPPKTCALCGEEHCEALAFVQEECRVVHRRCVKEKLNLPQKDAQAKPKVQGSYWGGILGALLGAAVAALPNWAQVLSDASVNRILYLFLPFMATLLYRLFRGKAKLLVAGVTVLAASFVVAFGLELVWFWVMATSQAGYNISLANTTALYFEIYTLRLSFQDMAPSLLFLLVGFFPSTILLRRYVASKTMICSVTRGKEFVENSFVSIEDESSLQDIDTEKT